MKNLNKNWFNSVIIGDDIFTIRDVMTFKIIDFPHYCVRFTVTDSDKTKKHFALLLGVNIEELDKGNERENKIAVFDASVLDTMLLKTMPKDRPQVDISVVLMIVNSFKDLDLSDDMLFGPEDVLKVKELMTS